MKSKLPALALGLALLALAGTLLPPSKPHGFDRAAWARRPVLADGRVKPLDTVARNSLLLLQGRQKVVTTAGVTVTPTAWLLDVCFRSAVADTYPITRIDHADVPSLLNLTTVDGAGGVRFSFTQLRPGLPELDRQSQLSSDVEPALRSPYQSALAELHHRLMLYDRIKFAFQAPDQPDFPALLANATALQTARPVFEAMDSFSLIRTVPPIGGASKWLTTGGALAASSGGTPLDPVVLAHQSLGRAWTSDHPEKSTPPSTPSARNSRRNYPPPRAGARSKRSLIAPSLSTPASSFMWSRSSSPLSSSPAHHLPSLSAF